MLNVSDLKENQVYDILTRALVLFDSMEFLGTVKPNNVRTASFVSKNGNILEFNTIDAGPTSYWRIYPEGIGKQLQDITTSYIKSIRLQKDRFEALHNAGYVLEPRAMGAGGVGQIRATKKEIRIQVGAGYTRYNQAMCVILSRK